MVLNLIVTECGQVKPELSKLLHQTAPPAEVSVSFAGLRYISLKSLQIRRGLSPGGFGFGAWR